MGRGGGGGRGFSGGFGGRSSGSRSFGGRSSSGGRGGGLSGRSGSGGFGFGGPIRGYGGGGYRGGGYRGGPGISLFVIIAIIIVILAVLMFNVNGSSAVTRSTYQREPLPAGIVHETEYIQDDADWLGNSSSVRASMRSFYQATGVQPYLWITELVNDSRDASWEDIEAAMEALYQSAFTDEGHLIILFYEPYENIYRTAYLAGSAAKTVIDDEAANIILDYFDRYYYSDMDDDAYFSAVFSDSATRIMHVTRDMKVVLVFAAAGLVCLFIVYKIIAMLFRQRNLKRQQDITILNTDVDKINVDAASTLADKYEKD
jgi:hypothetical protein